MRLGGRQHTQDTAKVAEAPAVDLAAQKAAHALPDAFRAQAQAPSVDGLRSFASGAAAVRDYDQPTVDLGLDASKAAEAPKGSALLVKRETNQAELDDVVTYWTSLRRGSNYRVDESLVNFLGVFTPEQIKGAMWMAKASPRPAYFKYLCGILHNWRKDLKEGRTPPFFEIKSKSQFRRPTEEL